MTQDELDLLHSYLHDTLSEPDFARLQTLLRESAEARRTLRALSTVNAKLQQIAAVNPSTLQLLATPAVPETRRGFAWLSWRSLAAAAAGIVFGIFCTSVVWAYAAHEARLSLLHESFEGVRFGWQSGFPKQMGQWGGDEVKIVSSEAGVNPRDGVRMLKLEPVKTDLFNRTHCIVDLQKQSQALGSTTRQIELRASFHPSVLGKKDRYVLRAAAFADEPAKLDERWMKELWPEIDEHALAYAARGVSVPAGTDGWQTITLMIDVPPGSRFLVISMWAATMDGKPANRAAHYLDDVRLSGVINEPLP